MEVCHNKSHITVHFRGLLGRSRLSHQEFLLSGFATSVSKSNGNIPFLFQKLNEL